METGIFLLQEKFQSKYYVYSYHRGALTCQMLIGFPATFTPPGFRFPIAANNLLNESLDIS